MSHPDVPLSNATLAKVLGENRIDSWTRRLRELREPRHGGYTILTHRDRKSLAPDEYLFPRQDYREPVRSHTRVSGRLRAEVFARDGYTCQSCGLARGQRYEDGRKVTLHLAHNVADSHDGKATLENCFTLCSRCNEAESNVGPDRPALKKSMSIVRSLPGHEQREIYEFLKTVFET